MCVYVCMDMYLGVVRLRVNVNCVSTTHRELNLGFVLGKESFFSEV